MSLSRIRFIDRVPPYKLVYTAILEFVYYKQIGSYLKCGYVSNVDYIGTDFA